MSRKHRPKECPNCESLLSDTFTWESGVELRVNVTCNDCDWHTVLFMDVNTDKSGWTDDDKDDSPGA